MPTVPKRQQAAASRPPIDPQLRQIADEIVAAFRAATQKAVVSQSAPERATLTSDSGSIEHTMLTLFQRAPGDAQLRASERILATLDSADRPVIDLRSTRSAETQFVPRADLANLAAALELAPAVKPPMPVVVVAPRDPVTEQARKAIDAKHAAAPLLGKATTAVTATPDGAGRFRHYEHGSIYWTAKTGAHEVHGAIREKWASLSFERGVLGYPTSDETATPDDSGRFNHFQGGSIYWTAKTGAHEVHGAIREKWAALGFEKGFLGYPTTGETVAPDTVGRFNHFQGGSIYWTPARGAFALHAEVRDVWASQGHELGELGYPIEDTQLGAQKRQRFEGGAIENREIKKPKSKVQLRLHAVAMVDETTSAEIGDDEMFMGGAAVDASGTVRPIERFHVADFDTGDFERKPYDPPKVLHTFRLADSSGWPKTYVSTLLLAEVDSGGFTDMLKELLQKVREYALELVKKASAALGAAIGAAVGAAGGIIGAALGAIAGYVVGALFDWLNTLWDDVALSPVIANATVPDVWAFSDSKDDVDSATGAGGHYKVRTDYALR